MKLKTTTTPADQPIYSIRGRVIGGLFLTGLLVTGIFGWAARADLAGAVVLTGEVAVDRNLRVVQHADGGIVQEILVSAGDAVEAGDVLIRLDNTAAWTERAILHGRIAEFSIRRMRLEAQRELRDSFDLPEGLDELVTPRATIMSIYAGELRIFEGGIASYRSRREQLELGIQQVRAEIEGLEARLAANGEEIELVSTENSRVEELAGLQLTARNAVFSINRENVRLQGERGDILSMLARARSRISELDLDILAMDDQARTDAQQELREIETQLTELNERRMVVETTLARTDIRAPIAGRLNDLNINSVGGVISPAEILATIVPEDANLVFTGQVPVVQIEQVEVERPARLRFSAFEQSATPEIAGIVEYVAAAATRDEATGGDFYDIRIEVEPEELALLGGRELRPGMPVEIYVTTSERTALSYLVKPFRDQIARAFRER
ncbi:HlyD family type I secretion periplasmic adaptor subunit [Rhodobacteraceae bacterium N5(2021)]|uniref:Membrane fusion protein (MFP) family protein n=1 Tax=Gymnodinialimonas phycosphaerae TaxID=2841589 RepID=A0A975YEQ9_9RHOB|nr:HlyD family type I secretion periplasmic adaptor subunit [Gymnodinialimonas phycosphaerae]MBY4893880.1 HlyD family type I secretion periplasmic adaptor subunit [Gymnodinialimonas phycosphaerae]